MTRLNFNTNSSRGTTIQRPRYNNLLSFIENQHYSATRSLQLYKDDRRSVQGKGNLASAPFFTTPLVSLQRSGLIGFGESRIFLMEALGGFFSLREQIAQEIGPDAEAEMVQRAGFASAERLIAAGRDSGELTPDINGFNRALGLLASAGYGQFRALEVRFEERWARIVAEGSIEGWMFRESRTRPAATCDYIRGVLAGIMHFLSADEDNVEFAEVEEAENGNRSDISCVETACIAAGEETCQFVLGPASLLLSEGLHPAPMAHSSVRETLLRLNRQLEQILDSSRKDPLTKLYNRSYFESALRQKIGYAKRRSDVISLAIIDIDYFKTINDTQGHSVGDRVLRQIARHLEIQARENDVVARLGGDEFVWLMPATTAETALAVAHRLRRTLEELEASIGFKVSASIGVANYPQDATTPSDIFERADTALFAAKRAGRDRAMKFAYDQLPPEGREKADTRDDEPYLRVSDSPRGPIEMSRRASTSQHPLPEPFTFAATPDHIESGDGLFPPLLKDDIDHTSELADAFPAPEPTKRSSRYRKAR